MSTTPTADRGREGAAAIGEPPRRAQELWSSVEDAGEVVQRTRGAEGSAEQRALARAISDYEAEADRLNELRAERDRLLGGEGGAGGDDMLGDARLVGEL